MPYLPEEIEKIASDNKITNKEEIDAFRHMYAAATFNDLIGGSFTRLGGEIVEAGGMAKFYFKSLLGLTEEKWADADNERYKDYYNYEIGIKIGQTSNSEQEVIEKIKEAINSGDAIINPADSRARFERDFPGRDDLISENTGSWRTGLPQTSAFVEGEGDWQRLTGFRTADADSGTLLQTVATRAGGEKSSPKQIALTSAAALAAALIKARQREQEDVILNALTGKTSGEIFNMERKRGGRGGMFDQSGPMSFPALFTNWAETIVGGALERLFNRTRTTRQESGRSREAARNWRMSRGQQQAALGQWMQGGGRNV